ncbi:MAG: lipoprotein signal peptidase [Bacteroidales bacterium]|nr:lipoprotein signal peptidase [Bacteroidales bacterium]
MKRLSPCAKCLILFFLVLIADQAVKFWIKTHMTIGQDIPVCGQWFLIRFIENNGMAFGFELGGSIGKFLLSLFRIAAVGLIGWYIHYLLKTKVRTGFVLACTLVFAGAIGNIIDSMFYGLIFDQSTFSHVASFMPEGGGYAGFLKGKVVDMLYFPIIKGTVPQWFPFSAGEEFIFFRPIFNLADSAITIGVFIILLFYRNTFAGQLKD